MIDTQIPFRLIGIKTEQFAVLVENFIENAPIQMQVSFSYGLDETKRGFTVIFNLQFITNEKSLLILKVGGHFEIEENAWNDFVQADESEKIIFPVEFVRHMGVITVGTTRGILHVRTENTILNNTLLPALNLKEIIKEDVVFEVTR